MGRPNDRTYDISIRQTLTVRVAAAIVATNQKYGINLTPPPPFVAFSFYYLFLQRRGYWHTIIDRNEASNRYRGTLQY